MFIKVCMLWTIIQLSFDRYGSILFIPLTRIIFCGGGESES